MCFLHIFIIYYLLFLSFSNHFIDVPGIGDFFSSSFHSLENFWDIWIGVLQEDVLKYCDCEDIEKKTNVKERKKHKV